MFAKFFINRPVVAMVIAIVTVILGIISMISLPISQYPEIVPPVVQVTTTYNGADAKTVAESVAAPIEQQMAGVDDMQYMYSNSTNNGSYTLNIIFETGTDPNMDQVLAQMRQGQANAQVPDQVKTMGLVTQKSFSSPLMVISLFSDDEDDEDGTYDGIYLANYAYVNMVNVLKRIKGVGNVQVFGAGMYAMRVWVDPDRLASLNLTVPDIIKAIQTENQVNPVGQVGGAPIPSGQNFTYTIRAQGRMTTAEEFQNIIVRSNEDGTLVRIKDVGRVELGAQNYLMSSTLNNRPTAAIAIYQTPGSNAIDTVDSVEKQIREMEASFPPGIKASFPLDTTQAVRVGIEEIGTTLGEALLLVILVVFVFLQGWRATLIPAIAVPVSIIGTFAVFPLLGFTINTIGLLGIVLAIGLVVDDAIVVVENVEHHMDQGLSPKEATIKAMQEVTGPVIAIAIVLSAVFLPSLFLTGITGSLFQQFAVTIAVSVLISAFNALTLSPALAAMLLKPKSSNRGPLRWFYSGFDKIFGRVNNGYVGICGFLIRKMVIAIVMLLGSLVALYYMGKEIPGGFLPEEDQGYIFGSVQLPPASSLERTEKAAAKASEMISSVPGISEVTAVSGFNLISGAQSSNNALFFISLKPWSERKAEGMSAQAIQQKINGMLYMKLPEALAFTFSPPAIPGVGASGGVTMVLEDRADKGLEFLTENTKRFIEAAQKREEIMSVTTTYDTGIPQIYISVDKDKVAKQGINLSSVYQTLQCFMGGSFVNYFNIYGQQWQVYVQAEGSVRTDASNLARFYVPNRDGQFVPLSTITSTESIYGPDFRLRFNMYTSAQINASGKPGYSSAQVMSALEEVFKETQDEGMGMEYKDMSYQEKLAQEGVPIWLTFALSAIFVFLILAAQYESWSLPISVLSTVPIAVVGAYAGLILMKLDLNLYAEIGLIMLIGLSAKNAILIVEFAKAKLEGGSALYDAAVEGARLRLRPILMTSFAFILGCLPLALASGAGASSRQVIGVTVIGGMLAATVFATFLVPASFYFIERLRGTKPEGRNVSVEKS